jgi:hypothetical protein
MLNLKYIQNILICSNVLVALAAVAFTEITLINLALDRVLYLLSFVFSGTLLAYTVIKNYQNRPKKKFFHIWIAFLWLLSIYFFLQLTVKTQVVVVIAALVVFFYMVPLHKNSHNGRQMQGFKIVLVAACWTLITYFLPLMACKTIFQFSDLLFGFQRFMLIYGIMCVFEIVDLQFDNPNLKTLPQRIGISKTKFRSLLCFLSYLLLEMIYFQGKTSVISILFLLIYLFFLWKSSPKKSRIFSDFWLESVPIFWWIFLYFFSFFGTP